jgi:hypothetical protein
MVFRDASSSGLRVVSNKGQEMIVSAPRNRRSENVRVSPASVAKLELGDRHKEQTFGNKPDRQGLYLVTVQPRASGRMSVCNSKSRSPRRVAIPDRHADAARCLQFLYR